MPTPFARLEDTPHGQALVTLQADDQGPFLIVRGAERGHVRPELKVGPWADTDDGWAKATAAFEAVDLKERAANMADLIDAAFDEETG
jgi:hypothetical protein